MKKVQVIIFVLALLTFNMSAQVAPKNGKKTLEVKEEHEGEYLQTVTQEGFSDVVIEAMKKRLPNKLSKYGFTDITITEVGQVPVPEGWASKLGEFSSNKKTGQAMMTTATTYNQMVAAADKMYEPEDNEKVDWKFQVNFMDNNSNKLFKVRINMMSYNPLYIIKESDLIKDLAID